MEYGFMRRERGDRSDSTMFITTGRKEYRFNIARLHSPLYLLPSTQQTIYH
jgi:hypothetical protein